MISIIDNFYTNVDEVRAFALDQSFNVKGTFPGCLLYTSDAADE